MIKEMTLKEFEEIKNDGVVIVDFFTTWCGDCAMMKFVYENLHEQFKDKPVTFIMIDAEKESLYNKPGDYNITNVPTFIVYKDGVQVARDIEYQPIEKMTQWLNDALK